MGTADYVAPERIQGASGDTRTDVWSAGILLHRVIYGYTPFHARTPLLTLERAVSDPVVAPWRDRCEVSETEVALFEVVLRALDKRPEYRFDDAASMGKALAQALESGDLSPHAGAWLASREEDTAPLPIGT
jgi:eukaryotic-like serine/threonine-protein kinase